MAGYRSNIAYWIGVVMAGACVAFVFAHHRSLPVRMEFGGISLVWLTGGAAILSILVHELIDSATGDPRGINAPKPESVKPEVPGEVVDPPASGSGHRAA
jgi:hypothetical protein